MGFWDGIFQSYRDTTPRNFNDMKRALAVSRLRNGVKLDRKTCAHLKAQIRHRLAHMNKRQCLSKEPWEKEELLSKHSIWNPSHPEYNRVKPGYDMPRRQLKEGYLSVVNELPADWKKNISNKHIGCKPRVRYKLQLKVKPDSTKWLDMATGVCRIQYVYQ